MSVLYTPIPASEFFTREDERIWLQHFHFTLPTDIGQGRYPTPNEIQIILEGLEDFTTEYIKGSRTWQIEVFESNNREQGTWTEIVVLDFFGKEGEKNTPHEFYFDRGDRQLAVRILEKLARICGPFILVTNGLDPMLVMPSAPLPAGDETGQADS